MCLNAKCLGFFSLLVLLFVTPTTQANAEDASKPIPETSQGISPDDVECKEGLEQVWKNDGTPICVEPENVLKLIKSGAIPSQTIEKISILDRRAQEVSENVYVFQFEYCAAVYNEGALGAIVSSDTEKIPVPIDPNIQIDQCQHYGTQIHTSSDSSLKVSLFYEKDLEKFIKIFDKKRANLGDDLIHYQQKLLRLEDPNLDEDNLEEIDKLKKRIELVDHVIQSYKEGLNTLRALK